MPFLRRHRVQPVGGVGVATRDEPRTNYTEDPYFTDGLRVVFFLGEEPTSYAEVELLDWRWPEAGPEEADPTAAARVVEP